MGLLDFVAAFSRNAGWWAGLKGVDFFIVSSRRTTAGTKGATVVALGEWFSVGGLF